jgi:hypothetical protein
MNNKLMPIYLVVLFSLFATLVSAETEGDENKPETIDCSYDKDYIQGLPTNLVDLQQQAAKVGQEICLSSLKVLPNESIEVSPNLTKFAEAARKEFNRLFPDNTFDGISKLSESWYHQVTDINNDYRNFALIEGVRLQSGMPPRANIGFKLYADASSNIKYILTQARKDHCSKVIDDSSISPPSGVKDCKNALDIWGYAVSPFQYLYTNRVLEQNGQKIINLQGQWKNFIKDSRYQTPLDVWATTAWYSDQFKRYHLSGPPSKQLFLFHPAIVYEYSPDSDKGSREDVSIAIEWAGINWWRSGFGFSVTSVYKDRKDQPSVGTGATFHVKNQYSIGYIYRDDGDDSIFFNVSLKEWFGDKKEKYKKYKAYSE